MRPRLPRPPRLPAIGRGRDRRWLATRVGIPVAVVAIAVVAVVLSLGGGSDAAAQEGEGSSGTATVQRRDLADRESFSGTLGYGDQRDVLNGLEGTITWIAAEGATRARGTVLYRVDEQLRDRAGGVVVRSAIAPARASRRRAPSWSRPRRGGPAATSSC